MLSKKKKKKKLLNIFSDFFVYLKVKSFRLIMDTNFIQMAASASHTVAYTIVRVFRAPNVTILLVYMPAKIKMCFIWKYDFFLPKSASSVSRYVATFPSVVQTYTQSYSFGGRIELIMCQIRHEPTMSETIHEISTSWKKS